MMLQWQRKLRKNYLNLKKRESDADHLRTFTNIICLMLVLSERFRKSKRRLSNRNSLVISIDRRSALTHRTHSEPLHVDRYLTQIVERLAPVTTARKRGKITLTANTKVSRWLVNNMFEK
ncbi:hypothetical protein RvY_01649 [Ramazzottius varieornatus]|uniref:Uncharacterized protein n=1 Tax=Ramazzottius varieornatus TaxID=947166 RepID=A0A1D1URR9_RAMVA|nr:hypothetical protein RvY_01649 [Ramazzottius varieornatus]